MPRLLARFTARDGWGHNSNAKVIYPSTVEHSCDFPNARHCDIELTRQAVYERFRAKAKLSRAFHLEEDEMRIPVLGIRCKPLGNSFNPLPLIYHLTNRYGYGNLIRIGSADSAPA